MPIPFPSRPLLALPLMAPLFGCTSKPAEPPIVLRPPHAAPRATAHRPPPRARPEQRTASSRGPGSPGRIAAEEPAASPPAERERLTDEQKDALFRDFDAYLNQPGRP